MLLVAEVGDGMSEKIHEQLIEQIRSQTDIVDLISEYVQLTKRGRNWFGLCPFHGEKTPSFSVSIDKQIFHCFGCNAGGNVYTFLMEIENITFQEAVKRLGERIGIHVDIQSDSIQKNNEVYTSKEQKMIEAHEFAAQMFHHFLMNTEDGERALNYLLKRGFTKEHIETNGIGWSLPNWNTLTTVLEKKGYSLNDMVQCGLIVQSENGNQYFDRFRGRIMFPIRDEFGKIIAFSGRAIDNLENEPKYLNSPESPIFKKSEILFNLHKARTSIRKKRQVILMEGFMDVLAANQGGLFNAVATMGTSLTEQHITKIKRLVNNVILCYDGDNAGWEATKRAAEMLNDLNMKVEIALIPNQLDPDSYIQQYGTEMFVQQIIEKPHSYISFMMMYARKNKNFQFENDILQYIHEVLELLVGKSPIERDLYIKQLVSETNVSEEAIYSQYRKLEAKHAKETKRLNNAQNVRTEPFPIVNNKSTNATERAERLLLGHMLHNQDIVNQVLNSELPQPFIRDEYATVFIKLVGFYEEYEQGDYQRFLEILDDSKLRNIVLESALTERDPEHEQEEITDCIKQLKKRRIELEISKLMNDTKEAEKMNELKKALEISNQIIQLKKQLSAI